MENSEISRIIQQLRAAYEGPAWHGPATKEVLPKISAKDALKKVGEGHNIAELVFHMIAWRHYLIKHLQGEDTYDVSDAENLKKFGQLTEERWKILQFDLEKNQTQLVDLLASKADDFLLKKVGNRNYNFYVLIHGVIQHDLYHLGQIVMINKYA